LVSSERGLASLPDCYTAHWEGQTLSSHWLKTAPLGQLL